MVTTVALYARVSSPQQLDGYSLEVQLQEMRELAAKEGWTIVREYVEKGFSAKTAKRPEFQMLMRDARLRLFDGIVVHKLDRLYRNQLEMLQFSRLLSEQQIELISMNERFDFNTTSGSIVLSVMGALSEVYVRNLSDETKKGKFGRTQNGLWNGSIPFGFCRGLCSHCQDPQGKDYCPDYGQPDKGEGKALIAHPRDSRAAQQAFTLCQDREHSSRRIAEALNQAGYRTRTGKPFTADAVVDILRNPFYAGWVTYKGEKHRGGQPALVEQKTFDECQEIITHIGYSSRNATNPQRFYLLTGLVRCSRCGNSLIGHTNRCQVKGGEAHESRFYRERPIYLGTEPCPPNMIAAERLEAQVEEQIKQIHLPDTWKDRILRLSQAKPQLEEQDRRRRELRSRLSRLQSLYVKGSLTSAEYDRSERLIQKELADLDVTLARSESHAERWVNDFGALWERLTRDEKKQILRKLVKAIYVQGDNLERIELREHFKVLFDGAHSSTRNGKASAHRAKRV